MNRPPDEPPSIGRSNPDPSQGSSSRRPSRRTVIGALVATTAVAALIGGLALSSTGTPSANAGSSTLGGGPAVPTASTTSSASQSGKFGSVTTSPGLSAEFKKTFTDQYIEANGLRQHAVIGGEGPPLLLVHGWPENWYAWRLLMPALARNHTVIAVDQRGIGLTEKPPSGYDTGTLAKDLAALMDKLGHERFSLVGHDTGMIISYALAADYPDRVERVALAEVPGPPGVVPSPPLFVPEPLNNRLWHIPFNRADAKLVEELVSGREDAFYGYEFKIQGGGVAKEAIDYYVRLLSNHESLSGSFGFYRAWDATIAQNEKRAKTKLKMPVLGIGGQDSWGKAVADSMKGAAVNVQTAVIPATGHWLAEQSPDRMVAVLAEFLSSGRVNAEQGAATSPPAAGK
ncbi:alpha/beta hydrolase [Streptomyces sp. NBC_01167]|uniref:alpha/beta fold hydrolase n=1 Tax=Streptomyces sp. NBC_01167 TaxID=2903756 RepID=UPI0038639365|nr:alpha/beta hydrolase [Streptomyces sp. NBC_01167]